MKRSRYAPLVWFVLGFGIFMFTRMSKLVPTIPVAMLVAPVFILRFARTQPARRAILLTFVGFLVSINIGLWGLFDLDGGTFILVYSIVRSSLLAILYFVPYMIDRLVYPKFAEIRHFPSAQRRNTTCLLDRPFEISSSSPLW